MISCGTVYQLFSLNHFPRIFALESCITAYSDAQFNGLKEKFCNDVPIVGKAMDDRISSFYLSQYSKLTVYMDENFGGKSKVFDLGTMVERKTRGDLSLVNSLNNGEFNDKISSLKVEPKGRHIYLLSRALHYII